MSAIKYGQQYIQVEDYPKLKGAQFSLLVFNYW